MKVFISCADEDAQTRDNVRLIVNETDLEVIDASDIELGQRWRSKIDDMINVADIVIVIATGYALRSAWVPYELSVALDRNKFVIPLLRKDVERIGPLDSLQHITFPSGEPTPCAGFEKGTPEHAALSKRLVALRKERGGLSYPRHHLRERRVTRLPFLVGLLGANLGVVFWWSIDWLWKLFIQSTGTWQLRNDFTSPWPSIWAASSLLSVYVAVWMTIRHRRGSVGAADESRQWIRGAGWFAVSTAVAGFVFYDFSGVDPFLRSLGWPKRTVEVFSTTAWSSIIPAFTIIPFVFARFWKNVLSPKSLIATVPLTVATALVSLVIYFVCLELFRGGASNDVVRGWIEGGGLRSGLFVGMYFSSVQSSIR